MGSDDDSEFTFVCPECDEHLSVNDSMRTVLIEKGCVICGASVTAAAFSRTTSSNSS